MSNDENRDGWERYTNRKNSQIGTPIAKVYKNGAYFSVCLNARAAKIAGLERVPPCRYRVFVKPGTVAVQRCDSGEYRISLRAGGFAICASAFQYAGFDTKVVAKYAGSIIEIDGRPAVSFSKDDRLEEK